MLEAWVNPWTRITESSILQVWIICPRAFRCHFHDNSLEKVVWIVLDSAFDSCILMWNTSDSDSLTVFCMDVPFSSTIAHSISCWNNFRDLFLSFFVTNISKTGGPVDDTAACLLFRLNKRPSLLDASATSMRFFSLCTFSCLNSGFQKVVRQDMLVQRCTMLSWSLFLAVISVLATWNLLFRLLGWPAILSPKYQFFPLCLMISLNLCIARVWNLLSRIRSLLASQILDQESNERQCFSQKSLSQYEQVGEDLWRRRMPQFPFSVRRQAPRILWGSNE